MKRKLANAENHKSITENVYKNIYVNEKGFEGNISLLNIKKVKNEWHVKRRNGEEECILAPKYKWLEMFPYNKNYAITAIFNENEKVIEWYIDIIKDSGLENNIPYIDDLYLDIVITHKNEIYVLDEDELKQALEEGDINEDEYNLAIKTGNQIIENLKNSENVEQLKRFTDKYYNILKGEE